jgi:hypothetical protein
MNGVNKDNLIKAMCRLAANLCSYTKQPCDCKYMQDSDKNIGRGSESGSGCPEITMAASILAQMTNQEFMTIAKRAGINISDDVHVPPDVFGMIRQFQDQRWEKMRAVPTVSKKKINTKSAYVPGKLPKGSL